MGFMPDALPRTAICRSTSISTSLRGPTARGQRRLSVVDSVEQFTNLTGIRDKLLRALSKGMKQRVSLRAGDRA